jgi:hypothetical protein
MHRGVSSCNPAKPIASQQWREKTNASKDLPKINIEVIKCVGYGRAQQFG